MDNLSFFQLIWITIALIIAIYYITKEERKQRGSPPATPHETTKPNENATGGKRLLGSYVKDSITKR
jgi:hypothetical protein